VLGQRKIFQRALPGFMHAFIFWGFLVLLTTILEALGSIVSRGWRLPWIGHMTWLHVVQDLFAFMVLVGLGIAVYIRKIQRPDRFKGSHLREADYILLWIFGIIVTLFGIQSTAVALAASCSHVPEASCAVPGGFFISTPLSHLWSSMSPSALDTLNYAF